MPRKAKEKVDEIEEKDKKKSVVKKAASKKADVSKKKTESAKKVSTKKADTKAKASTDKTKAKKTVSKKSALAKEGIDDEPKAKKKIASKSASKSVKKDSAIEVTAKSVAKKADAKTSKKSSVKKTETKTADKSTTKKSESKSATKSTNKKSETKPTTKSTNKKASTKTATKSTTRSTAKKSTSKKAKEPIQILEYYDLPYKYGNTVVRLLAQTPKTLFVYWEVSDSDINNFRKIYGDDFFNKTKPILIVHNLTLNKTYEVEINDFANCWYLNTDDTDCKFDIELARKFITNEQNNNNFEDYLYVAQSNNLQSPNDHILFEKLQEFVIFKDVSTNKKIKKDIKSFKFLKDIYKFYKDMYDEDILNNPSSQFKF